MPLSINNCSQASKGWVAPTNLVLAGCGAVARLYYAEALSRLEKEAAPAESHLKKIVADKDWPPALKEVAQKTIDLIQGKTPPLESPKTDKDKDSKAPAK